jgi:putative peptidoglycan lipid II flippase
MLAMALPTTAYIAVFAPDIVRLVFARGAFGSHAVDLTVGGLRGIAIGLWAMMMGWILLRMLNAAGRNRDAMKIIVAGYAMNMLVSFLLSSHVGTLGLGLGDASRGLTLLLGTAFMLGCLSLVVREILANLPQIAVIVLAATGIRRLTASVPLHLLLGALALAIVMLPRLWPQVRIVATALRRRLAPAG